MEESIFLINPEGNLEELNESNYLSEDELQKLLATYPKLISGKQIDTDNPRRWLLITREMGVPDEEDRSNRWSLDHLFLDQEGIPTLVEVKRSTDTRIRREVVGQILDYAANAVVYWKVDTIKSNYEKTCEDRAIDSDENLRGFLDDGMEPDEFWELVGTNLTAGKIRMLIIADSIPKELKRIIEFLNGQLNQSEFLGLEIKQFSGDTIKTLVPRVIGNTSSSQISKGKSSSSKIYRDENSFLEEFEKYDGKENAYIAKRILDWSKQNVSRIQYGHGVIGNGTMMPVKEGKVNNVKYKFKPFVLLVYGGGTIEISFHNLTEFAPFSERSHRILLQKKLNNINGIDIPDNKLELRPKININLLEGKKELNEFLDVMKWVFNELLDAVNKKEKAE